MYKQILINVDSQEKRVAVLEGAALEEFYVERSDQPKVAGNIYKGIVSAILPGMAAAFIHLGLKKDGFLHVSDVVDRPPELEELLSDSLDEEKEKSPRPPRGEMPEINKLLKKGQDILVQVVKEPIGTKGARLTTHISMPGRLVVLLPYENHFGVSKRIAKQGERMRLKKELSTFKLEGDTGFIVRTAGSGGRKKTFVSELNYLMQAWNKVKKDAESVRAPALLYSEHDLVLRVARDMLNEDVNRIVIDSKEEFKKIAHYMNSIGHPFRSRIKYYKGEAPLFERFAIDKQVAGIYENRAPLKNRGYLVIEQTEGLVAIDVNTGGFVGEKSLEDTAFVTNIEAAKEIARQIRLRDIGGILVIDFIDMEEKRHRQQVFETLKEALKRDKARTKILNVSELGLVEMTRQRMRRSVEGLSYRVCPYCSGRGTVKSVTTVAIETRRKLAQALKAWPKRQIVVTVHADVCQYMLTQDKGSIAQLESRYRRKIIVRENPAYHIEQITISDIDTQ